LTYQLTSSVSTRTARVCCMSL